MQLIISSIVWYEQLPMKYIGVQFIVLDIYFFLIAIYTEYTFYVRFLVLVRFLIKLYHCGCFYIINSIQGLGR